MVTSAAHRELMVLATKDDDLGGTFARIFSSEYDIEQVGDGLAAKKLIEERRGDVGVVILDAALDIAVADLYVDSSSEAPSPEEGVDAFLDYLEVSYSQSAIRSRYLGDFSRGPLPILVAIPNHDPEVVDYWLDQGVMEFLELPLNERLTRIHVNECVRVYRSLQRMGDNDYDELTGLLNRSAFWVAAREMIDAEPDCCYNLIISDIENFKRINERYGEAKGSELLRYTGQCLGSLNNEDVLFARYSGDQFVGLFRQRDLDGGDPSLLSKGMDMMYRHAPVDSFVVKFGLYLDIDKTMPMDALCDRALMAVRTVKHQYGKAIAFYDSSMSERQQRQLSIIETMEQALDEEQFCVLYQPKHDAKTGVLIGAEALVRWNHPTFGFMAPSEFITLFEQNGFIPRLDYYVWRQVCRDLRRWIDEGRAIVPISVNVSRRDFFYENYFEHVKAPLREFDLEPSLFHLEITETNYLDDPDVLIPLVNVIRDWGAKIELDDFGSGYSSLGILSKLPIDVVKLDVNFARNLADQVKIIEAMIDLAHRLGCTVVAEGVEEQAQVDTLRELGCDALQGYFFAEPMSRDDFDAYLGARGNQ